MDISMTIDVSKLSLKEALDIREILGSLPERRENTFACQQLVKHIKGLDRHDDLSPKQQAYLEFLRIFYDKRDG